MNLHINTSDLTKIIFTLMAGRTVVSQYIHEMPPHSTHKTLEHLEAFLKAQDWSTHHKPEALSKILLYKKEGSPTGLRLGSAIAQGLSLAWGIPVALTDTAY